MTRCSHKDRTSVYPCRSSDQALPRIWRPAPT